MSSFALAFALAFAFAFAFASLALGHSSTGFSGIRLVSSVDEHAKGKQEEESKLHLK